MFRFYLTYNNVQTEVEEPKGWSDFKSEIKRDFKSHGVIFKYTSGTLKLGFADGRDILEDAFQLEGFDAEVLFTVDRRQTKTDIWTTVFEGNAVMKNRELSQDYFEIDFESSTFQQKVINRLDTKVKLSATEDLDGNTLSGVITPQVDVWYDIRLINRFRAEYKEGGSVNLFQTFDDSNSSADGTPFYSNLLVNFSGELETEFKDVQTIAEIFQNGQLSSNSGKQNFIVSSENPGDLTINATVKFRLYGTINTDSTSNIPINFRLYVRHENTTGVLQSQQECYKLTLTTDGTDPYNYDSGVLSINITETTVNNVNSADRIFFYGELETNMTDGGSIVTSNDANIEVYHSSIVNYEMLKEADANTVYHYFTHDVIERILYIITGENGKLNSDFLGLTELGYSEDGCGGLTSITNGYLLRTIQNLPEISLSEVLKSLHAIYGIGYSFENVYGEYKLRVELLEDFYGDSEIIDLGYPISIKEGGSYKENTFDDLIFNKVEIGYSKFTNDENNTGDIDDFLTKTQYALPITSVKGGYNQVCPLITSGRVIQATYETKEDLTKSWKYDNDNFFVALSRSGGNFIPELDENFESVGGFDNSASNTAYNLRFAPVYMFLNHALIVNSALMGKPLTDIITNTSVEINKNFSARFNNYEECLLGDSQRLSRTSTGNIAIGDNYEGNRLFNPIQHELAIAMTTEQLDLIIDAMENNATDEAKNYGYLTYRDDDGQTKRGYPILIQWNPNDEIANITTLEKADNYGV
jgi:hypothetical protein